MSLYQLGFATPRLLLTRQHSRARRMSVHRNADRWTDGWEANLGEIQAVERDDCQTVVQTNQLILLHTRTTTSATPTLDDMRAVRPILARSLSVQARSNFCHASTLGVLSLSLRTGCRHACNLKARNCRHIGHIPPWVIMCDLLYYSKNCIYLRSFLVYQL